MVGYPSKKKSKSGPAADKRKTKKSLKTPNYMSHDKDHEKPRHPVNPAPAPHPKPPKDDPDQGGETTEDTGPNPSGPPDPPPGGQGS